MGEVESNKNITGDDVQDNNDVTGTEDTAAPGEDSVVVMAETETSIVDSDAAGEDDAEEGVKTEEDDISASVEDNTEPSAAAEAETAEDMDVSAEEDEAEGIDDSDEFSMPLVQVVEAVLFAADEPLTIEKIAKAAGTRIRREAVGEAIAELQTIYRETERAFEIVEVAEKFQMFTRAEFAVNVQALYGKRAVKEEKDKKLSPAALDTLAIIAYKQPVTRAEVEAVRGVGCGQVMRQLMERGSIRPVGKKMDVIGYPLLYGTTDLFLQEFGLASLDMLPMAAELRRLTKVDLPAPEVVAGGAEADDSIEVHSKLEDAVVIEADDTEIEAADAESDSKDPSEQSTENEGSSEDSDIKREED